VRPRAASRARARLASCSSSEIPPDNDALALLSRLQRRSLRVPDDIALVGFDDEDFAAETFPSLTTVSQPLAEMARRAVVYLLDRLAGVDRACCRRYCPTGWWFASRVEGGAGEASEILLEGLPTTPFAPAMPAQRHAEEHQQQDTGPEGAAGEQ
jgi:Periplasmic binding protein-like domain